jgi:hypothetical protein
MQQVQELKLQDYVLVVMHLLLLVYINVTEEYNGTSWSAGGNLNTARYLLGGAGLQTAALAFGGSNPGPNSSRRI